MNKKIAILQSNYIPWKGYFDLISYVDEFIILDSVQYTKRDWRNRNKIKTANGIIWLTVPVDVKGKYNQKVCEAKISNSYWQEEHWKTIKTSYAKAPFFKDVSDWLKPLYLENNYDFLSELNLKLILSICDYLSIKTHITSCSDYEEITDGKSERLAQITLMAGGNEYVSGPAAKSYLDKICFHKKGIYINWFDYLNYEEYNQLWGDFIHQVSILDLLFNCGPSSRGFMRY